MPKWRCGGLSTLLLVVICTTSLWAQTAPPADLDQYVARTMKEFAVPGLSVAIVKDGKVVLTKGYGEGRREMRERYPRFCKTADSLVHIRELQNPLPGNHSSCHQSQK